ncbi:MAG TPA: hypothetical protein EYP59_05255 [Thiotrichaceae bacterium]|nr:hypothetical protein [Thiotrichaceae bacterium]
MSIRIVPFWQVIGKQSHLHVIGDGAPWYASQVDDKLGLQGSYLVDFLSMCVNIWQMRLKVVQTTMKKAGY